MRKIKLFLMLIVLVTSSCVRRNDLEPEIKFTTTEGDIVVKLYKETPKHRDNFVKLVDSGYYNGVLFHRVIADFMIQAGDRESIHAGKNVALGSGDLKYTIPAEFAYPQHYHKKGALAAARQGDNVNPERASSGAQFYIVKGHTFTDKELDNIEANNKTKLEAKLFQKILFSKKNEYNKYVRTNNLLKRDALKDSISNEVQKLIRKTKSYKFTKQQRKDYKTIGGTPHLDGEYTVFGEVVEGIEFVSNISNKKTGKLDRPIENIRILNAERIK
jgi:cyclophilin family peptidyl-prolyl cis-trans isomerase